MSAESGWTKTEIVGKQADVFVPNRVADQRRCILFLHGHGLTTLSGNDVFSTELDRHGLFAVCLHGQRSWWLPVVCQEFDAVSSPIDHIRTHVLNWIAARWQIVSPAIGVLGVSMGGQGALQLGYRYPNEFPVIAALSPVVDLQDWYGRGLPLDEMFPDAESARQQSAILQIHGLNWLRHQWIACDPADSDCLPGCERLASKLRSSGVPFESGFSTTLGGHSWSYFNHMAPAAIRFLSESLAAEFRRIV